MRNMLDYTATSWHATPSLELKVRGFLTIPSDVTK